MRAVWVNICCRNSILYAQLRLGRPNLKDRKTMSIEKPRVVSQLFAMQYYRPEVTAPERHCYIAWLATELCNTTSRLLLYNVHFSDFSVLRQQWHSMIIQCLRYLASIFRTSADAQFSYLSVKNRWMDRWSMSAVWVNICCRNSADLIAQDDQY